LGIFDKVKDLYGEQSPEEKKLADHVKQKIEEIRGSTRRVAAESIWLTNCAYSIGYPVFWNSQVKNFQPTDRAAPILQRNRIYVNKILPVLQNRLARLLKNPPKYDVRPESQDNEDKEAARLGLEIINWQWDRCNIDEKRISLGMWAQQCGHAYVKVSWDDALGKPMVNPETGELDYEGDVRVDICSAFELFPDPLAKSFDDVLRSWIIQAKVRPLDYFRKQYPEKGHLVKQEDAWLQSVQFEGRLNSMSTKGSSSFGSEQMKNAAIELVKYEARSKDHPNGRMIVVANNILLEDKELPCGEIPFAKFDDIIVGGKYDSEAVVTHLRPLQDTFNSIIRKRADWTSKLLAGKYVAARGTAIAQEAMNDRSGELLWYTPVPNAPNGGRPEPMQIPMIPQWAYTESEMIEKYFNDIAGISEVSQGHLPSSSIPAIGMALLQEQDETRIGIMTDQHERAWARIGGLILKYVEKYYKDRDKRFRPGNEKNNSVGDVYGAVTGYGYKKGTEAYRLNSVWDSNNNNVVEKGEMVQNPDFKRHQKGYFEDVSKGAAQAQTTMPKNQIPASIAKPTSTTNSNKVDVKVNKIEVNTTASTLTGTMEDAIKGLNNNNLYQFPIGLGT